MRCGNEKSGWEDVAALFHEPSNWLPRLLTVPAGPPNTRLTAAIFQDNARQTDVTEQIIIDAHMLPPAESSLDALSPLTRCTVIFFDMAR
jgi:hypothetical protein